jgi:hypothetical protein
MAYKMKVRHAMVNYTSTLPDGRKSNETAFRGAVVTIEDRNEYQRLLDLGALIEEDAELERPGRLMDLPETASDEEILNWVANASQKEIDKLAAERPEIAERLRGSLQRLEDMRESGEELLGQKERLEEAIDRVPEGPEYDHLGVPLKADDGTSQGVQQGTGGSAADDREEPEPEPDTSTAGDFDFDMVVRKNVQEVADFVADHPHLASEVLQAENRLAMTTGKDPRTTVVRAVEAAAGHTQ